MVGPVESVQAYVATLARRIQVEDAGVVNLRWRSGAVGSMNVTMLTYPKNLEGSITILGELGILRVSGVAVNEIQHWEFADQLPDDVAVQNASYETTSVYRYARPLDGVVATPEIGAGCTSVYAQDTIDTDDRDEVVEPLKRVEVPTAVQHPVPLHLQPAFSGLNLGAGRFPNAESAAKRVFSLPMPPYLTEVEQTRVAQALKDALRIGVAATATARREVSG